MKVGEKEGREIGCLFFVCTKLEVSCLLFFILVWVQSHIHVVWSKFEFVEFFTLCYCINRHVHTLILSSRVDIHVTCELNVYTCVLQCNKCGLSLSPKTDSWKDIASTVTSVQKFNWLRQRMTGHIPDMPLLNKIIEFVLYEHPIDIEKLRRSLHHQVTANMDFKFF